MNSNYIGITIGPIIDTLANTKATRELWAASYSFSYIMKEIIRELKNNSDRAFILPYVEDINLFSAADKRTDARYKLGSGVFPDRIIFKAAINDTKASIEKIASTVIDDFATKVAKKIYPSKINKHVEVVSFIRQYYQIDIMEMELGTHPKPILVLSDYLNTLELQRRFPPIKSLYLQNFFSWVNSSFLVKDAFGEDHHSFETLLHIASRTFAETPEYKHSLVTQRPNHSESDEASLLAGNLIESPQTQRDTESDKFLISELSRTYKGKEGNLHFKPAHKYIAIVYSDGDNIGNIIKAIENDGEHKHAYFSKQMNQFALNAVEKIREYGGMPVYAGGDDLLFFAPVITGSSNIFQFLQELDTQFKELFNSFGISVSQSFGLSINYYKHPLSEALASSRNLLFGDAKKTGDKNNIAFRLQKHSGSYFGSVLHLVDGSTTLFLNVLNTSLKNNGSDLLRSVIYKIRESEKLIGLIGKDGPRIINFLKNNFNEQIHHREPFKSFLTDIGSLINHCYTEPGTSVESSQRKVYSILRTVAFLTQNEDSK